MDNDRPPKSSASQSDAERGQQARAPVRGRPGRRRLSTTPRPAPPRRRASESGRCRTPARQPPRRAAGCGAAACGFHAPPMSPSATIIPNARSFGSFMDPSARIRGGSANHRPRERQLIAPDRRRLDIHQRPRRSRCGVFARRRSIREKQSGVVAEMVGCGTLQHEHHRQHDDAAGGDAQATQRRDAADREHEHRQRRPESLDRQRSAHPASARRSSATAPITPVNTTSAQS